MSGSRHLRLFIAFRLPPEVVEVVAAWQRAWLDPAQGLRLADAAQLHVTMVFLGSRPAESLDGLVDTIEHHVGAARRPSFRIGRYHETSRVGMLVLHENAVGDDSWAGRAQQLVGQLIQDFELAGSFRREHRSWRPHITVARFRDRPRLLLDVPAIQRIDPVDVTLYESTLAPGGATYRPIVSVGFAG